MKRSCLRHRTFVGCGAVVLLICGVLIGGEKYPEVGPEIVGKLRQKYDDYLKCALKQVTGPAKEKLKHCKGKEGGIKMHGANKKNKHWRHGTPAPPVAIGFTPHATPENLKKCKLCMVVNEKFICERIGEAGKTGDDGQPTPRAKWFQAWLKGFFRHEAIHWTQYDTWDLWRATNEDLFNEPFKEGEAEGKNGNPQKEGGLVDERSPWLGSLEDNGSISLQGDVEAYGPPDAQDPKKEADKLARKLIDQFDEARSAVTEFEAQLFGNVRGGCISTEEGKPYFEPKEGEDKSYMDKECCKMDEEKTKLYEIVADVKTKEGDAYKKVKAFAQKLCDKKEEMCKKIEELKAAKKAAKKKWQTQDWKQDEEGNDDDRNR